MYNKVCLIGNVGKDIEERVTADGKKFVNFTLATNEAFKDKNGERQAKTEWHRITVWNEFLVDLINKYVRKGSKLYIEGKLHYKQYEHNGEQRVSTEIVINSYSHIIKILQSGGVDTYDNDEF